MRAAAEEEHNPLARVSAGIIHLGRALSSVASAASTDVSSRLSGLWPDTSEEYVELGHDHPHHDVSRVAAAMTTGKLRQRGRLPVWISAFLMSPHGPTRWFARVGGLLVILSNLFLAVLQTWSIRVRSEFTDAIAASLVAKKEGPKSLAAAEAHAWWTFEVMMGTGLLFSILGAPLLRLLRKQYTFSWRMAVTVAYLSAWEDRLESLPVPEGASQRIHEDVTRMADVVIDLANEFLQAGFSIVLFVPQLHEAGATFPLWQLPQDYLLILAFFMSGVGLLGVSLVSRSLVGLYVSVQQTEGAFRKRMAVMEDIPSHETGTLVGRTLQQVGSLSRLFGVGSDEPVNRFASTLRASATGSDLFEPTGEASADGHLTATEIEWVQAEARHIRGRSMMPLLGLLRRLYFRTFRAEMRLAMFSNFFEEMTPNVVWLVTMPALFDSGSDATPGTAMRIGMIYASSVSAFSIFVQQAPAINELRSILHRLHGYEAEMRCARARLTLRASPTFLASHWLTA